MQSPCSSWMKTRLRPDGCWRRSGDLLRTSLGSEVTAEVALSQELAFIEGYLAIEQTRFGERLRIDMDVPLETRDAMVPNMLLQPLVENAVRYGVAPLVEGGWIAIKSALQAGRLRIVIRELRTAR